MGEKRRIAQGDPEYPSRLLALPSPPRVLTVDGELPRSVAVAIVGARKPHEETAKYAKELAAIVVQLGGCVLSGGARGIDAAAHRGALDAGGPTCVVAPTGASHVFPYDHAAFFDEVVARGGTMLWPFPDDTRGLSPRFLQRNGVLVALADAVVIVQASLASGTLNAASWAMRLSRPLLVMAGGAWLTGFDGNALAVERGGRLIWSTEQFRKIVSKLTISPPALLSPQLTLLPTLTAPALAVLEATERVAHHVDEIASRAGLPVATVATALLTLALENVVVEGPDGFFRRVFAT